jgi:hypothetical protein
MKKVVLAVLLSVILSPVSLLAQEKRGMPMGEHGGMGMEKMKQNEQKMGEMRKGMGTTMKEKGMMKAEDMKNMGKSMGDMSGMMGDRTAR